MATYVLIHGAWHGGWKWRIVAPALRRAGHEVYAPSLTGMGERKHLAHPGINLDTHIQDVVSLIEMEDLNDVLLLGHSYGGMVVTGVADRVTDRIRHLIYLDAFVPENGKCLLDYAVPERAARMKEEGEKTGLVTPPPMSLWGLTKPEHLAFAGPREVMHAYGTMSQRIRIENPEKLARLSKTFIYCSSPATGSFDQFAAKYRNDPAWRFHELKTGHDAMTLIPDQVIAILLQTAQGL
jgi:pimeloyl-ACP methyl ester carboxylesterase